MSLPIAACSLWVCRFDKVMGKHSPRPPPSSQLLELLSVPSLNFPMLPLNHNLYLHPLFSLCFLPSYVSPFLILRPSSAPSPAWKYPGHPRTSPAQAPSFTPPGQNLSSRGLTFTTSASTHILTQNLCSLSFCPSLLLSQDPIVLPFQGAAPNLPMTLVHCPKSSIVSTVHINFFPSTVLIPLAPWSTDLTLRGSGISSPSPLTLGWGRSEGTSFSLSLWSLLTLLCIFLSSLATF